MRNILFLAVLAVLFLTSSTWGADISGTWTVTQKNNEGVEDSFDIAIKAAGDKLTITGNHSKIGALSGTGILKGDDITMTIDAAGAEGKGALSFAYTGKVSGNRMSGTKDTKMSGTPGGGAQGAAPSGQVAPGAAGGQASGGRGQAPAGSGQPPAGAGQAAPSMAQGGGAPGASGWAPGAIGNASKEWTAVKK